MYIKFFNPLFLWRKRKSIVKRILELPSDLMWKLVLPFIRKGYISNYDFEKIQLQKDVHQGQVALLLGNGPSVQIDDLEKLNEFVSFACNRIHLSYSQTSFRPDYVLSSDEQMIEDFGQEIIDNNKSTFLISKGRPFFKGNYTWCKLRNGRPFNFSFDIDNNVMAGGGTLISAIQIAHYMGINKFIVYGVDHSFKFEKVKSKGYANAVGDGNHFIKGYRSGKAWQAPVEDLIEEAFIKSDKIMRSEGGYIINVTRGGCLEVLERQTLEEYLNN